MNFFIKDVELSELRANMKAKSSGDIDLETIPDCVSLGSFNRKSSQSSTLPNEARTAGMSTQFTFALMCIISWVNVAMKS